MNSAVKKLKRDEKHKFRKKGNQINHKHQETVQNTLEEAYEHLERGKLDKVKECLEEGKCLISARKREILLADKHGWNLVQECQRDDLAENSDDEKRIRRVVKIVEKRKEKLDPEHL